MYRKVLRFGYRKRGFRSKVAVLIVGIVVVFYFLMITLNAVSTVIFFLEDCYRSKYVKL